MIAEQDTGTRIVHRQQIAEVDLHLTGDDDPRSKSVAVGHPKIVGLDEAATLDTHIGQAEAVEPGVLEADGGSPDLGGRVADLGSVEAAARRPVANEQYVLDRVEGGANLNGSGADAVDDDVEAALQQGERLSIGLAVDVGLAGEIARERGAHDLDALAERVCHIPGPGHRRQVLGESGRHADRDVDIRGDDHLACGKQGRLDSRILAWNAQRKVTGDQNTGRALCILELSVGSVEDEGDYVARRPLSALQRDAPRSCGCRPVICSRPADPPHRSGRRRLDLKTVPWVEGQVDDRRVDDDVVRRARVDGIFERGATDGLSQLGRVEIRRRQSRRGDCGDDFALGVFDRRRWRNRSLNASPGVAVRVRCVRDSRLVERLIVLHKGPSKSKGPADLRRNRPLRIEIW